MESAQPVQSCAFFSEHFLRSGNCQMLLFSWRRFREPAWESLRKLPCANSSQTGNGRARRNNAWDSHHYDSTVTQRQHNVVILSGALHAPEGSQMQKLH